MKKGKYIKDLRYRRDIRLATAPAPSGIQRSPKRSQMLDIDGNNLDMFKNKTGNKSYSHKAKEQGLYISICTSIRKFRQEKRDSTFAELAVFLRENFPTVFSNDNIIKYPQNLSKVIAGEKGWSSAYFSSGLTLLELAEQRMYEVLENQDINDKEKMIAYDRVMKYDLARKELEREIESKEDSSNDDMKIIFGFNKVNE